VTQFTLLQALSRVGEVSQGRLGNALAIDSTTLTRTLGNLRRAEWIAIRPGTDMRVRLISVTASGRRQLERSYPAWERPERLRTPRRPAETLGETQVVRPQEGDF
jgi:DNA-binding MarR family transcriptional regulator